MLHKTCKYSSAKLTFATIKENFTFKPITKYYFILRTIKYNYIIHNTYLKSFG